MAKSAICAGVNGYHAYLLYTTSMKTDKKMFLGALAAGFVLGVFWLAVIRFVTYKPEAVHYHANFALYIDGVREDFDSFTFYEEVASCDADELNNPKARVHMHDNVNYVAHIHDNGATWGHFFANLGYTLGNDLIKTDAGVFVDGQDDKNLRFVLNGNDVQSLANQTIGNEDVLLINYGDADAQELKTRYDAIIKDAAEYNERDDPSSCKGNKPLTFGERLKKAIGI